MNSLLDGYDYYVTRSAMTKAGPGIIRVNRSAFTMPQYSYKLFLIF